MTFGDFYHQCPQKGLMTRRWKNGPHSSKMTQLFTIPAALALNIRYYNIDRYSRVSIRTGYMTAIWWSTAFQMNKHKRYAWGGNQPDQLGLAGSRPSSSRRTSSNSFHGWVTCKLQYLVPSVPRCCCCAVESTVRIIFWGMGIVGGFQCHWTY